MKEKSRVLYLGLAPCIYETEAVSFLKPEGFDRSFQFTKNFLSKSKIASEIPKYTESQDEKKGWAVFASKGNNKLTLGFAYDKAYISGPSTNNVPFSIPVYDLCVLIDEISKPAEFLDAIFLKFNLGFTEDEGPMIKLFRGKEVLVQNDIKGLKEFYNGIKTKTFRGTTFEMYGIGISEFRI